MGREISLSPLYGGSDDEEFGKYHEKDNLVSSFSNIDVCGDAHHYCEQ